MLRSLTAPADDRLRIERVRRYSDDAVHVTFSDGSTVILGGQLLYDMDAVDGYVQAMLGRRLERRADWTDHVSRLLSPGHDSRCGSLGPAAGCRVRRKRRTRI